MSSWLHSGGTLKKSQYYVWFLGSSESEGLRGADYVLPVMQQLLENATRRFPNKVTVQISNKGIKLVQSIPTISKTGKLKMEVMKFCVPCHSLAFSMVGPPPWTDVVSTILLVYNPDTRCPVHVHCYRCDSPETAAMMHTSLQSLICRRENQRRLDEMEHGLRMNGLLPPVLSNSCDEDISSDEESEDDRVARLHTALFIELKERLRSKVPIMNASHMHMSESYTRGPRRSTAASKKNWWKGKNEHASLLPEDGAMTSSTSGLGSELSSSAGRFRFSISEIPQACSHFDNRPRRRSSQSCLYSCHDEHQFQMNPMPPAPPPHQGWRRPRPLQQQQSQRPMQQMRQQPQHSMQQKPTSHHWQRHSSTEQLHCLPPQSLSPSPPFHRDCQARKPCKALRMFGDTFKFQKRSNDSVMGEQRQYSSPLPPPLPERRHKPVNSHDNKHSMAQNWITTADRRYRSVDNLHLAAESDNFGGCVKDSAWNLPGMFDPFGKKYEQRPKVDGFWKNRAKRSSWYIPSGVYAPI